MLKNSLLISLFSGNSGLETGPISKTPPAIVARLNTEFRKIIDDPEVKAKIAATGFEAFSSSTEELDSFVKEQLAKWSRMIKDAGIEPQ